MMNNFQIVFDSDDRKVGADIEKCDEEHRIVTTIQECQL